MTHIISENAADKISESVNRFTRGSARPALCKGKLYTRARLIVTNTREIVRVMHSNKKLGKDRKLKMHG